MDGTVNGASPLKLNSDPTPEEQIKFLIQYTSFFNLGVTYEGDPQFLYDLGFEKLAKNKYRYKKI
jgi:hypothetical protein